MKSLLVFAGRPAVFVAALVLLALGLSLPHSFAQEAQPETTPRLESSARHGLSLFGDLKYPPGFERFDYVNPNAPKGGLLRLGAMGSFDSLNAFIVKGDPARGLGLIYDTLMVSSMDEPGSEYGLIAETVSHPDDYSSVTFTLRAQARWHDGEPITPDDVLFSFDALTTKGHPFYRFYYANVVKAEKVGERGVRFVFNSTGNRELPLIMGQLQVLPKHYWEGVDVDGNPRNFASTTLVPPLASGPYRVGEVSPGRSVEYVRVNNYWGADLPVNIGQHNFDRLRYEFFRDDTVALEAFKADQFDLRFENSAKNWATQYDIAVVHEGRMKLATPKTDNPEAMQSFVLNLRKPKFANRAVREAFNYAFDFEWTNANLFYDQYQRTDSFFAGSDLAAQGLPQGKELEILNGVRDALPREVFTQIYKNPRTDTEGGLRANLSKAAERLGSAGWVIEGGALHHAETGEVFSVEFLLVQPTFERVVSRYKQNLERLGIQVSIRIIDSAQYENRMEQFDFDIVVGNWAQSLSPGNEQREFWGSEAASRSGSRNLAGIKSPVIDALVDQVIFAPDRETLVAATRALDRVLLWSHYVVPQWHVPHMRIAHWNRMAYPEKLPTYNIGFPMVWWSTPDAVAEVVSGDVESARSAETSDGWFNGIIIIAIGLGLLGFIGWRWGRP